jgi:uncharacterized damage-inducible protein DinB
MANYTASPSLQHLVSLTRTSIIWVMTNSAPDPILDRLFRHMAWANQILLGQLQVLSSEALALTSENEEWSVAVITQHFVRSAGFYVSRVSGDPLPTGFELPVSKDDLSGLAKHCAAFDARLGELATMPEAMTTYQREGKTIVRARSTILGQSIHHATEHRAQIADILSFHGIKAIDLDEMDVWAYSDAEGLGA